MSRLGLIGRCALLALAFLVLAPPHWIAMRLLGRRTTVAPILFHRLFLWLFSVRVTQSGTPPDPGEAALVLSNHVSWLDIVVIGSLRPLSFVAKSEIASWPVINALAALQRTIYIDRQRRGATATVSTAMGHRLAEGELVVLFAEGTTGDGNRLLPFRSALVGAARAALQAEAGRGRVRLQPLAIAYPRRNGLPVVRSERSEIAWYGDMDLAPHLATFVQGGPIDVQVVWGKPITFEATTDRKVATAAAEAEVRAALTGIRTGRGEAQPSLGARPAPPGLDLGGSEIATV
ncbi:1-acyl-sn-glycerol-3-phosphate acyltransferase [Methylobacterium brachiatum]|uniref:1-acyl-sn-glycerol-3-phosphate acyltransferase n=1 Tax=Methylobacterium brachiatum TaxID=269660 RepID=A0AAJ1WTQ0_9HYPH|nr:lysophospholipid acyltransferase family protein [Methylobacterium brachiatum]MCB4801065.1 1-acyl-sn-glycerol-3-phosphate acyltransferase [Methylobacterium brachiatum]MDQ0541167.1 1-acyl-sn-glycerol-3-phosphate acyltransferase [Methylobacterium brachiatum]